MQIFREQFIKSIHCTTYFRDNLLTAEVGEVEQHVSLKRGLEAHLLRVAGDLQLLTDPLLLLQLRVTLAVSVEVPAVLPDVAVLAAVHLGLAPAAPVAPHCLLPE